MPDVFTVFLNKDDDDDDSDKGGPAHPDPEIRGEGGGGLQKKFFQPFRPQFGLKIRRRGGPPGSLPWIRH